MFERLDFVYTPSNDVASDVEHYRSTCGAEAVWAIDHFETRVAMLRFTANGPAVLLAEHLEGPPILIFRVPDLEQAVAAIGEVGEAFGMPVGEGVLLRTPATQRMAIYEAKWADHGAGLAGRFDF